MICSVAEPLCHKPQQGAKSGIENSCLVDPTNLVGSRDSLRKSRAGATPAEHSLRVYTMAENVKTHEKHHRAYRRTSSLYSGVLKSD